MVADKVSQDNSPNSLPPWPAIARTPSRAEDYSGKPSIGRPTDSRLRRFSNIKIAALPTSMESIAGDEADVLELVFVDAKLEFHFGEQCYRLALGSFGSTTRTLGCSN